MEYAEPVTGKRRYSRLERYAPLGATLARQAQAYVESYMRRKKDC